ncbi:MAG: polysulfide reductase NrfD [Solirubrobacterales bacterium]|nr:polysulfide reductase NrfD [Solirubrobacterales bacterium]MBV9717637.1 polysulfide reductase NrfD [Solirubrobacterales bacterium]
MSHGHGPPPEQKIRERGEGVIDGRDTTPAVGRRGEPGGWRRAVEGARVRGFKPRFEDGRWSFLYRADSTRYAAAPSVDGEVAAAARRMRGDPHVPVPVKGPVIRPNVWTWEVPLYFWFGGIATGAAFAALGCQAAGDERSARVARMVAIGAVGPGGPLLILDLGRPERFLHMFRILKTRSPMSMGAWCLMAFSNTGAAAVAADLLRWRRCAKGLTVATAALGTYLGSYTGVLLASTAVPVWNRSRRFLPPIFICTASASGAAVTRLALAATGTPSEHPTRSGLAALESVAMTGELVLSAINEHRLGIAGRALEEGRPGRLLAAARALTATGLVLRAVGRRGGATVDHLPSVMFLAAALAYRFGWVGAGRTSALDHEAVATLARRP